jgi:hypothetical protein
MRSLAREFGEMTAIPLLVNYRCADEMFTAALVKASLSYHPEDHRVLLEMLLPQRAIVPLAFLIWQLESIGGVTGCWFMWPFRLDQGSIDIEGPAQPPEPSQASQ